MHHIGTTWRIEKYGDFESGNDVLLLFYSWGSYWYKHIAKSPEGGTRTP